MLQIDSLFSEGVAHFEAGRAVEAELFFRQVLELSPEHATVCFYLARCCEANNRIDEAIEWYTHASNQNPEYAKLNMAEVFYFLGLSLGKLEQHSEAIGAFLKAQEQGMYSAKLCRLIADCYQHILQFQQALIFYEKALALQPDDASVRSNFGYALCACGRYEEAKQQIDTALSFNVHNESIHNNAGLVLMEMNRHAEAITCFDSALAINPTYEKAMLNKSLSLLTLGQYQMAWPLYEVRPVGDAQQTLVFKQKWRNADIRCVLIEKEQGFGDIIQMVRYLPFFNEKKCYAQIPAELSALVARSFPEVHVIAPDENPAEVQLSVKMFSLPFVMDTNSEALIPQKVPYLLASEQKTLHWRQQLAVYQKPLIGIVWRGTLRPGKVDRSMPVEVLAPLLSRDEVQFIVLQKDISESEKAFLNQYAHITILDEQLTDFDETAAVMKNLTCVMSICSSPLHLAGALGVKAIAWLPHAADWRWMLDRSDSAWYRTTMLVRQHKPNDWASVIAQTVVLLKEGFLKDA